MVWSLGEKRLGRLGIRNMAVVGNAGKGRSRKRWRDVLKDDLKKTV